VRHRSFDCASVPFPPHSDYAVRSLLVRGASGVVTVDSSAPAFGGRRKVSNVYER
jgi:hypothetical protein